MSFLDELPRPFFALAPMDDVTDTVFRQVIDECAPPDLYFTEFVNVDGLQSPGRDRLMHKLRKSEKDKPIIAQLWGLDPENYYKTTKDLIEMGYDGVDINMGCPVKTVVKNGACAALIKNTELAGEIIDAAREGASGSLPISVKTRVGYNEVDLSWLEFLFSKKLDLLSIHARTARQLSKVPADWDLFGQIVQLRNSLSPSTLVVGNGDIVSRAQGLELAKKYQLDGVMVGRGIFADPFLFSGDSRWAEFSRDKKLALYQRHITLFIKTWQNGERRIETLNKFCKIYINGFDGAKELREKLMQQTKATDLLATLEEAKVKTAY